MVQKSQGRRTYRSAQGKQIDLDLLISRNELTPAVGNAKVNARGDELGPGGKIIRKKEDMMREYYESSPGMANEKVVRKAPAVAEETTPPKETVQKQVEEPVMEEWEEDEDGNFIRKAK